MNKSSLTSFRTFYFNLQRLASDDINVEKRYWIWKSLFKYNSQKNWTVCTHQDEDYDANRRRHKKKDKKRKHSAAGGGSGASGRYEMPRPRRQATVRALSRFTASDSEDNAEVDFFTKKKKIKHCLRLKTKGKNGKY